ncbi:alpha/beta fold hydrolase [Sedimentitalea sp.]|uniref:alpha/beta fold hydrolase n=1 Tax=Sedimentitalea sp. TaxID=2048915 RepID=UPI0032995C0D
MSTSSYTARQKVSFVAAADGTRIAVAETGKGNIILKAGNWLSHVSRDEESPIWQHWLKELSRDHLFIRYDLRGCGLSDRNVTDVSFDAWLSDLEAVADTIDGPVTLLGLSQGCALSIVFALRHPEKVQRLVLMGGYAQGMLARSDSAHARLEADTLANLVQLGWGRDVPAFNQVFTNLFVPSGTPEQHSWWRRLERESVATEMALRILEVLHQIDVLTEAGKLKVPTLIFHTKRDARIPFDEGRKLATLIDDAQFFALESANHILLENEPAWEVFLETFRAFMPETTASRPIRNSYHLTDAEADVVALVAKGLGNHEIATALKKSEKTVRNQITVALAKVNVRSRSELIVKILSDR